MKLLLLEFQAFGPFVKKQTIDFTVLNDKGMFLINGPTGTGKTTIFDAVTYALYGKGSGKDRDDGKSLRSDFASDDLITYVNLTFEANGKIYQIYRQAPYKRKKQRGEGYTEEQGKVELTLPDKTVIAKTKDVDDKIIKEILFMSRDQFKNVALLAQGEFTQLITADSKSRAAILEHIFQKEMYNDFQDKITAISNTAKNDMELVKKAVETLITNVEDGENIAGYNEALVDPANIPSFLENVNERIEQLNETAKESHKNADEAHKAYQESSNKLNNLKSNNAQIEKYLNALKRKEELDGKQAFMDSIKKAIESQTEVNELKPLFGQLVTLNSTINNKNQVIKDANEELQKLEADKKWLKDNKPLYESNKNRIEELGRIIPSLEQLVRDKQQLLRDKQALERIQSAYDKEVKTNKEKEEEYISIKTRFFASSASNLAEELEEGQPCPVCGSIHHPTKAHTDDAVSEAEYNEAEEEYKASNTHLANSKTSLESLKATFKQKEDSLIKTLTNNGYEDANQELLYSEKVNNEVATFRTEKTDKSTFNQNYENKDKQVPLAESRYNQDIKNANQSIEEANKQINSVNSDIDAQLNKNIHVKTREDYLTRVSTSTGNVTFSVEKSKNSLEKYNADKVEVKTIIENTPEELKSKGLTDEAELVSETNAKKAIYDALNAEANALDNKVNNLKHNVTSIQEKYDECKAIIEKCTSLTELAKTTNGSNRMKLSFRMYILADYFDKIIVQANHRLTKITNGRYKLVRSDDLRKGNALQGLDLDVYDIETGKERPASSLSGGEKFVSALSLALGLSDIIETNHALIQVESIFIDEGFGTLDDTYIDMAMKALESLKQDNKTVAIISHVEKLKSYIPDSLVVSKAEVGSTIKLESKM